MAALDPSTAMTVAERTRLIGILSRLASDHMGERAAAGFLASRMLRTVGLTWEDLLTPLPQGEQQNSSWRADLSLCIRLAGDLTDWEQEFVAGVASYTAPTARQRATLSSIVEALPVRGLV